MTSPAIYYSRTTLKDKRTQKGINSRSKHPSPKDQLSKAFCKQQARSSGAQELIQGQINYAVI